MRISYESYSPPPSSPWDHISKAHAKDQTLFLNTEEKRVYLLMRIHECGHQGFRIAPLDLKGNSLRDEPTVLHTSIPSAFMSRGTASVWQPFTGNLTVLAD